MAQQKSYPAAAPCPADRGVAQELQALVGVGNGVRITIAPILVLIKLRGKELIAHLLDELVKTSVRVQCVFGHSDHCHAAFQTTFGALIRPANPGGYVLSL